jgi:SHS2 domain-containing protein
MPFAFFEHKADIGIRGTGNTIEETFAQTATAMFEVMSNTKKINAKQKIPINATATEKDTLLIDFLNELLFLKDTKEMLFTRFELKIKQKKEWKLQGYAFGEKINPKKHELKSEVKAATYSQLKVEKKENKWTAQCIVDV